MGYSEQHPKVTAEVRVNRPNAGAPTSNQYGTFTVHYASKKQTAYIASLLKQKDCSSVTDRQREFLIRVEDGVREEKINKSHASDAIDILLTLPDRLSAKDSSGGPSEKQIKFFTDLITQRQAPEGYDLETFKQASRSDVRKMIDIMLKAPHKPREERATSEDLGSGIYLVVGSIIKVYRGQSGRMLAKELIADEETHTAFFEYRGLASRYVPSGTKKMSLEDAKEFGAIYGVCCNCGRTLTNEESIEAAIGPVCAKKF
jgi:hypothetical protein